tara:strand:- start:78 stop:398 length:321 start_codon:yes stop_codon:yes gene_type:complete
MTTKSISDSNFENEVLNSPKPVLVDFWAEWCGPCKIIGPILDEISKEKKDQIIVAKINIDKNPNTPIKYGIRGIPTLMLFNNGNLVDTMVGSSSKTAINDWIDSIL